MEAGRAISILTASSVNASMETSRAINRRLCAKSLEWHCPSHAASTCRWLMRALGTTFALEACVFVFCLLACLCSEPLKRSICAPYFLRSSRLMGEASPQKQEHHNCFPIPSADVPHQLPKNLPESANAFGDAAGCALRKTVPPRSYQPGPVTLIVRASCSATLGTSVELGVGATKGKSSLLHGSSCAPLN